MNELIKKGGLKVMFVSIELRVRSWMEKNELEYQQKLFPVTFSVQKWKRVVLQPKFCVENELQ